MLGHVAPIQLSEVAVGHNIYRLSHVILCYEQIAIATASQLGQISNQILWRRQFWRNNDGKKKKS